MKKDTYILIVIDMQPTAFDSAGVTETLQGCQRAIKKAIKNKNPIIFLEFVFSYGERRPTAIELTQLTDGYNHTFFLEKDRSDGSKGIVDLIKQQKLPKKTIKVCGVNTTACVLSTVIGLRSKLESTLHVLEDAVGGHGSNNNWKTQYNCIKNFSIMKS